VFDSLFIAAPAQQGNKADQENSHVASYTHSNNDPP